MKQKLKHYLQKLQERNPEHEPNARKESIMNDHNINTSQHLFNELENHMRSLDSLLGQMHNIVHNLGSTWTAIKVTQQNFKKENL